ncbi:uncharacterized protein LOC143026680 isoform X2 [Oratosquilla oratoria]|uniref:uncharacterized protein LOC143026680 isoform X2 n=1 Tax=Oratosquilla oratoria TaxID=337810 RepID=UPI003F765102
MGRRKNKIVAWGEAAKKRMQACWDRVKKEQSDLKKKAIGPDGIKPELYKALMPRKYVRISNRGEWNAEAMQNAISAVKEKKMGLKKASKEFNVPKTTLRRRVKEKNMIATGSTKDQIADADMDDPLKIAAPTLKEEIVIKEEPLDESEMFIDPGAFCVPTEKVGVKRERDSNDETETATEDEDMALWTIEHRVFAYDSYVKNNESVTAVQCEFGRHFNIHQNEAVPTHNTILCWVNALRTRGTLMESRF